MEGHTGQQRFRHLLAAILQWWWHVKVSDFMFRVILCRNLSGQGVFCHSVEVIHLPSGLLGKPPFSSLIFPLNPPFLQDFQLPEKLPEVFCCLSLDVLRKDGRDPQKLGHVRLDFNDWTSALSGLRRFSPSSRQAIVVFYHTCHQRTMRVWFYQTGLLIVVSTFPNWIP